MDALDLDRERAAFPTCVGMNRIASPADHIPLSVPYMCGDEPSNAAISLMAVSRSLHVWG